MATSAPCGGDAFECQDPYCTRPRDASPEWHRHPCEHCVKSEGNGGKCGGDPEFLVHYLVLRTPLSEAKARTMISGLRRL